MNNHNINKIEYGKDIKIKDLKLEKGSYAIFCWDRNQYYMIAIIDDIIYDKDDKSLGFYTISIYKIQACMEKNLCILFDKKINN